jgi:hypothetical protein
MQNLLSITLAIICSISTLDTSGQIRRTQLEGDWQTDNKDSLYYKNDSVQFHLDA